MYERFTDRARKIMQLANQDAQRVNHEYIGTEHLLVGLINEGSGVAAHVLKNLSIPLLKVREQLESIVMPGPEQARMAKLPLTPRAKRVVEFAIEESRSLNHNYVGTEHLLLGLLRESDGVAGQVLVEFGVKLAEVRQEILNLLGQTAPKEETPRKPTEEDYARAVGRIKEICAGKLSAREAFDRIAMAIKLFNESEPPDADAPLEFEVDPESF